MSVISVFFCLGGYRLSAAHTYRGVYQREFSVAFLMDKTSVRKKFVAKRAVPRKKKGKKLPGHAGTARKTIKNLRVEKIIKEENLILVRGAVPGPNGGVVIVRKSDFK